MSKTDDAILAALLMLGVVAVCFGGPLLIQLFGGGS